MLSKKSALTRHATRVAAIAIVLALAAGLAAIVAINTWRQESKQQRVTPAAPLALDTDAAAGRLAGALRFRTISHDDHAGQNGDEFSKLHAYLQQHYPRAHAALKRELIGGYSLLYTWPGSDPAARPIMLMAHQDVVPIAPGTEADWQAPPFGGVVRDGFIWGRGAWDDKGNLFSMMEAVEKLLEEGFQPRQTIYLAFGHDEEVRGTQGAKAIAALLQSRGVRLDFVLDEGLLITHGMTKGIDQPVALIGIAEKGYATVRLNLSVKPGHSSMPPPRTAVGMMSAALAALEENPLPADICGAANEMFDVLAPEMSGPNRVLLSNLWLFKPLVQHVLEQTPSTNAMLRTTAAPTIFRAGNKENVLPGVVEATVNFRLLPGDSVEHILAHLRKSIGNDNIKLSIAPDMTAPSRLSATGAPAYRALHQTVREVFPGTVVAPGLMVAATDSRYFAAISDNIYRFSPVRALPGDLERFHGTNERISVQNYLEMIHFYRQLLRNSAQPSETQGKAH